MIGIKIWELLHGLSKGREGLESVVDWLNSAKKPFTPDLDSLSFFKLACLAGGISQAIFSFRPAPYRGAFSTAEEPATHIKSATQLHDSELNSLLCEILSACRKKDLACFRERLDNSFIGWIQLIKPAFTTLSNVAEVRNKRQAFLLIFTRLNDDNGEFAMAALQRVCRGISMQAFPRPSLPSLPRALNLIFRKLKERLFSGCSYIFSQFGSHHFEI